MADIGEFIKKYSKYKTTFKETSHDSSNDKHLCLDESQENIDFDAIIADKYPDPDDYRPKSFDSVYIDNSDIYCIEFKSAKKPDKKDIEAKLIDGKRELDVMLADLNIQKSDYRFIFCVVYSIHKPDFERFKRGIQSYPIKMYLKKYQENNLVDDIFTEDVSFFTKEFKRKMKKDMVCH